MKQILVLKTKGEKTETEACEISNLTFQRPIVERKIPHYNTQTGSREIDLEYTRFNCMISFTILDILDITLWLKYKPSFLSTTGGYLVEIHEGDKKLLHQRLKLNEKTSIAGIFDSHSCQIPENPEENESWIGKRVTLKLMYEVRTI